jgi:CRP-like cAMP-binding protein
MGYLTAHRIWEAVPPALLEQLLREKSALCRYDKNESIWSDEENYRQALGLVLEGTAQVKKERLLLSAHHPGDYFGLATLYAPVNFYATEIMALTPCRVLFWDKSAIDSVLHVYPQAAINYISYMCERVYYLNARLDTLIAGSAARRLECHLRAIAVIDDAGRLVCSIPSRTALAQTLGLGRASLYRAMDELARQGLIERIEDAVYLAAAKG